MRWLAASCGLWSNGSIVATTDLADGGLDRRDHSGSRDSDRVVRSIINRGELCNCSILVLDPFFVTLPISNLQG